MTADSAFVFTQLHPIRPTCFWVIIGWLGVGQRSVNFGRLLGICNKKVERMVWTVERFHELTAVSWAADEMNNSLLATKNASLYHLSLDTPSCKMECSRMSYSRICHHVFNIAWTSMFGCFIRNSNTTTMKVTELWGLGLVIEYKI
jgi:hypothetical protein